MSGDHNMYQKPVSFVDGKITRDDIIHMAVKCQLVTTTNRDGIYMEALECFAQLVAAAEREACAKVCEDTATELPKSTYAEACQDCAHAILDLADARLVAAAPELLEALQSLVAALVDADEEGLIEHEDQIVAARAAISKARGAR